MFGAAAVAQLVLGRAGLRRQLTFGIGLLLLGLALLTAAVWAASLALLLAGGVLAGSGVGALFKGSVSTVLAIAPPGARGETLAGLFLAAYFGLAVPVVALGGSHRAALRAYRGVWFRGRAGGGGGSGQCAPAAPFGRARWPGREPRLTASPAIGRVESSDCVRGLMEYVNLGATGLRVSRICLGMMSYGNNSERPWVLDEDAAEPIVRAAAEGGVNFYDTADVYSAGASETATGRLLGKMLSREEVVVATKVHGPTMPGQNGRGLSRKHIMASIDASLARLDMDYVDLYQIHRWDPGTPIEETMAALHDVVKAGKARYIGASSMFAWQFGKAQHVADAHGWTRFVSMQDYYNLVYREEEREMIPQCIDQGVGVIPWSPLARGLLAGNRTRDGGKHTTRANTDAFGDALYSMVEDYDVADRAAEVAADRGVPPAQVGLAWLLHRPGVTAPIVGATKAAHIQDALAAEQLELSPDEMRRLEELYVPHPITGHS